jgi:hypothetical protein
MGEMKIRAVRSRNSEAESRFIVIDPCEEITNGYQYRCGCEVFEGSFREEMSTRGNIKNTFKLELSTDCNPIEACDDDVFEKPDIIQYTALSMALKASGYVFNKRLARLYKNPKEKGKT